MGELAITLLAAWVLLGWASAILLTYWDYNDGQSVTRGEIVTIIFVGGLMGPVVFLYALCQVPERYRINLGIKKFFAKTIWEKKPEEK